VTTNLYLNAVGADGFVEHHDPHDVFALQLAGANRARSHCRFALPLIHFIPDSLTYSVPLFLERQCDRTLGAKRWLVGPPLLASGSHRYRWRDTAQTPASGLTEFVVQAGQVPHCPKAPDPRG
jgi:hypothetical protein